MIAYLEQLGAGPPAPDVRPALEDEAAARAADEALLTDAPALASEGAALFGRYCVPCHGTHGEGKIGPSLLASTLQHGERPSEVLRSIALGRPERGMPAWRALFGERGTRALAAYVLTELRRASPPGR